MLAQHDLLRSGECTEMTLVDFLGLDVQGEMTRKILLDGGGIVAEIAAVGLAIDERVGIRDVGLVDGVELVIHAAALGHRGESFRLMLRVILHVRQQGPLFTTGVLAVFAFEWFFSSMCSHVFDQGALGSGGVDADVATERFFPSVGAQVGSQRSFLRGRVFAEVTFERLFPGMRAHVLGQRAVDRGGIRAETALERFLARMLAQVPCQRALFAAGVGTKLAFEGLFPGVNANVLGQIALGRRRIRAERALERLLLAIFPAFDFGSLLLGRRGGEMQLGHEALLLNEVFAVAVFLLVTCGGGGVAAHVHRGDVTFLFHFTLMRRQLLLRMVLLRRRLMLLRWLMLRRWLVLLLLQQMRLQMMMRVMHHFGGSSGQMRRRRRIMSYIHLRKTKDGNLMHQKRWRIQRDVGVWG